MIIKRLIQALILKTISIDTINQKIIIITNYRPPVKYQKDSINFKEINSVEVEKKDNIGESYISTTFHYGLKQTMIRSLNYQYLRK